MKRLLSIVILFVCFTATSTNIHADIFDLEENEVMYTFFSLPDGEALLITSGQGKHFLINTGSKKSEDDLFSQLEQLDITKLDGLIITKNSDDTCGNAEALIKEFDIKKVISHTEETCFETKDNVKLEVWKSGKVYEPSPGLMFRVVKVEKSESMSLFILFGNNSLLFMSEASEKMEELIESFPSRVEMLKIPEYALKNYPSIDLLKHLDPHLAIIYNIQEERLHEGLLERLNESWIDIYHLRTLGTIHILCNPGDYEVKK